MVIYYDFSGVFHWPHNHLTGIQRVECGIYKGLIQQDVIVKPIYFDSNSNAFYQISIEDLPNTVTNFIYDKDEEPRLNSIEIPKNKDSRLKFFLKKFRVLRKLADWYYNNKNIRLAKLKVIPPKNEFRPKAGDIVFSASASFAIPLHTQKLNTFFFRNIFIVRVIYDLIPTLKKHWVTENFPEIFTQTAIEQIEFSSIILTISNFSKNEILKFSSSQNLRYSRIEVIRLADKLGNTFPIINSEIKGPPFFLCVCTVDPRKNHRILYDAWILLARKFGDKCPKLIIVGSNSFLCNDLLYAIKMDTEVNHFINVKHNVSDEELVFYYNNCLATIFPSHYEGWGLPVAESLGYGKICISSNASSMVEIAPSLTEFFDPFNPYELVNLIEKCMFDESWRINREKEISDNFVPTDWTDTSKEVLNFINREIPNKTIIVN